MEDIESLCKEKEILQEEKKVTEEKYKESVTLMDTQKVRLILKSMIC